MRLKRRGWKDVGSEESWEGAMWGREESKYIRFVNTPLV